jgi:murein DD-endopeptidase MepM/ murein hydrolase activator NlpD
MLVALVLLAGCGPAGGDASSSSAPGSAASSSSAPASAAPGGAAASFTYNPPGQLQAGGTGVTDPTIYAPGIRFPIENAPAYPNSQVWGDGGMNGPSGDQCDAVDYAYPWSDDFCEARSYSTPLCPSGSGHQGVDIRPSTCVAAVHPAVAAEDGVISQIGTYTVYLSGDSGRLYLYLHMQMDMLKVSVGDRVSRGQELGLVSNNFGSSSTTIHLHFEIKEPITLNGQTITTNVAPYTSLVDAYKRLLAGNP